MKTKILVVALTCLSVGAVAQQSTNGQQPKSTASTATTSPAASGMATGKKTAQDDWQGKKMAHDDWHANQAAGVRESPSKAPLGHHSSIQSTTSVSAGDVNGDGMPDKTASPSNGAGQNAVMVRESPSKASLGRHSSAQSTKSVSAGDVNGDGMPDKTASPSNGAGQNTAINNSHSNIKAPRDVATGQASGKRQHQPVSVIKVSDDTPKK
jgi:hypothetical protein